MRGLMLMNVLKGWRRAGAVVAIGALAATASACGGDDAGGEAAGSGGSGAALVDEAMLAEARETVKTAREGQEFTPPGPAIDVGSQLAGKTVYWIGNANQVPIVRRTLEAGTKAAESVGMNVILGDAKGQPSVLLTEIEKAISRDVDAIITTSFSADSISAGLQAANDAGIPVILAFAGDPGVPTEEEAALGVVAKPTYCYSCSGKTAAAASIVDAVDNEIEQITAVSFQAPESPNSVLGAEGYVEELERLCPDCTVELEDAPVAKWNTGLTAQTESIIRREPDLNYMYASFDNILDWAIPGIANVGATDRVRAIGYNGSDIPMQNLKEGNGPVFGEIWSPGGWSGWSVVDSVNRALLGEEPSTVPVTQDRLFMGDDAAGLDIEDDAQLSWYGELDYASEFKQLWGVE